MVYRDGNQALAAEPGFRSESPGGENVAVIDRLKLIDPVDCVDAYPLKNSQPVALFEARVRPVMISLAGGVAVKAAPWPAVERVLHGKQIGCDRRGLPQRRPHETFAKGDLYLADTLFNGAIITRITHRTVQRDDSIVSEHSVDSPIIERTAVVALEEQGRPMTPKQFLQMCRHCRAFRFERGERSKPVPGAKILHGVHVELASTAITAALGRINGPGHVRRMPSDVLAHLPALGVLPPSLGSDEPTQIAARYRAAMPGLQLGGSMCSFAPMVQRGDLRLHFG